MWKSLQEHINHILLNPEEQMNETDQELQRVRSALSKRETIAEREIHGKGTGRTSYVTFNNKMQSVSHNTGRKFIWFVGSVVGYSWHQTTLITSIHPQECILVLPVYICVPFEKVVTTFVPFFSESGISESFSYNGFCFYNFTADRSGADWVSITSETVSFEFE